MQVKDLMTKEVRTCRPQDTLNDAAAVLWEQDCGCVPIVGIDSRLVGMLTDRDICMAAYTQGRALWEIPVSTAMSRDVLTCWMEATIASAEEIMKAKQVRRLPVIDEEGKLVGLLSLCDVVREAEREKASRKKDVRDIEVCETLAAICQPRERRQPVAAS